MDAADGHHRDVHGVTDGLQGLVGQNVHIGLGMGGKGRTHTKAVCAVLHSFLRFLHAVDGNADHHSLAHTGAHLRCGHILLPHVHALGVAADGNVHVVVHKERHTVALAQSMDLHSFFQKSFVVQLFFTQLHTGDTALQGAFHLLIEGLFSHPCAVGDGIQKHVLLIALHSLLLLPAVPGSYCKWHR